MGVGFFLRFLGAELVFRLGALKYEATFLAKLGLERLRGVERGACFLRGPDFRAASLRRFPPKPALICFADSLRRAFVATFRPFPAPLRAGF